MRSVKEDKNLIKKTLTKSDCIYLAGVLDTCGSICAKIVRDDTHEYKFAICVEIKITQHKKYRWWLNQIEKKIEGANVNYATNTNDSAVKMIDSLIVNSLPRVREFLKKLVPHLRLKQKQANRAIEIINRYYKKKKTGAELVELCKLVDSISRLNYSENQKITSVVVIRELKKLGVIPKDYPEIDSDFNNETC
jgi:hypothetical protein